MYAVISHLHLNRPVDDLRAEMEKDGLALLASFTGYQGYYLVKVADNRAMVVVLWDTIEHANEGSRQFGLDWFSKKVSPYLASDYQRSIGEVVLYGEPSTA